MRHNNPFLMSDMRKDYETQKDLGSALLACHLMIVPVIMPEARLLFQTFPVPYVTNTDSTEVAGAGGLQWSVPGVPRTAFNGSCQLIETGKCKAREFTELVMSSGGVSDCIVYHGRPDRYILQSELLDCAFTFEPGEASADGRGQVMMISGTLDYMYFGDTAQIGGGSSGLPATNGGNSVRDRIVNSINQLIAKNGNKSLGQIFGN